MLNDECYSYLEEDKENSRLMFHQFRDKDNFVAELPIKDSSQGNKLIVLKSENKNVFP